MRITSSLTQALTPTAVALGNFDGVHRGHQQVIRPVLKTTLEATINSCSGLTYAEQQPYSTVVTFNPHPQEFFTGSRRTLLTPLNEKVQQLTNLGVEQLVLLPFDRELAALSPQEFVEKILVQQLQAQQISVGQDFRFGYQRSGTASDLQAIAATFGVPVTIVPLQNIGGDSSIKTMDERISSSSIRQALEQGDLQRAQKLLGRPYTLTGQIVEGQQLGRTIGFPTANIQLPPEKFLPRQGVYAVQVFGEDQSKELDAAFNHEELFARQQNKKVSETPSLSPLASRLLPLACKGVMNIGYRPTVNGTHPSVEVHLLDWSGDLYGKTLTVQLEKFLRPEQKFASLEALKAQIQADCAIARSVLILES